MRKLTFLAVSLLLTIVVITAALAAWFLSATDVGGPPCKVVIEQQSFSLTSEQAQHATTIALAAKRLGMPNRAVTVGIATALQESKLSNIDYGDRDSVGIFQQRPSQGWGTKAQIMQPNYSATRFLQKLVSIPNWHEMTVNDASQAVQRSGHPTLYEQWEQPGRLIARSVTGEEAATLTCRKPKRTEASGQRPEASSRNLAQLKRQLSSELGSPGIDVAITKQHGWAVAHWLVARANDYGVSEVTYQGQAWSAKTGSWQPRKQSEDIVRIILTKG